MNGTVLARGAQIYGDNADVEGTESFFDGVIDNLDVQVREPEQQLWRAVVAQAVIDASKPLRPSIARSDDAKARWMAAERDRIARQERDEAIDWLTNESDGPQSFNWIALHVFDMEPKVLRARIAGATPALEGVL